MNRSVARFALACFALAAVGGLAFAGAAEDSLVSYYRKKNNIPPTTKVTIENLKDSTNFKGSKEGTVVVGEGAAATKSGLIASNDLKWVVFGDVVDTTSHPGKAVMDKIKVAGEPFEGAKDAKVTIVKYSDFQCPFCKRGFDTMENEVLKQYDGKIKYYFKSYPLPMHPWAEPGAIAAECAKEQAKCDGGSRAGKECSTYDDNATTGCPKGACSASAYWKLYKSYFENQQTVTPQNVKEKAVEFLKDSGIDMAKWNDCFDNKKSLPQVKQQQAEGEGLGVRGTPAFFVNGRMLVGAQPFPKFKDIIDDELSSAK